MGTFSTYFMQILYISLSGSKSFWSFKEKYKYTYDLLWVSKKPPLFNSLGMDELLKDYDRSAII